MHQTSAIPLRHQNFMLAVRREMGWPAFKPANDCIAFCSGHRQVGCDEGPISDYGINSSEDRLELFAIDVACGEDMAMRLARVCAPIDTPVPV